MGNAIIFTENTIKIYMFDTIVLLLVPINYKKTYTCVVSNYLKAIKPKGFAIL